MLSKKFLISSLFYLLTGMGFLLVACVTDEVNAIIISYFSFAISICFYIYAYYMMKKNEAKIFDIWKNIVFGVILYIEWICFSMHFNAAGILAIYILSFIAVFFITASNYFNKYYKVKDRNIKPLVMPREIRISIGYSKRKYEILRYISYVTNFSKVFKGLSIFFFVIILMLPILNIL